MHLDIVSHASTLPKLQPYVGVSYPSIINKESIESWRTISKTDFQYLQTEDNLTKSSYPRKVKTCVNTSALIESQKPFVYSERLSLSCLILFSELISSSISNNSLEYQTPGYSKTRNVTEKNVTVQQSDKKSKGMLLLYRWM